jgi:hypothetical protein
VFVALSALQATTLHPVRSIAAEARDGEDRAEKAGGEKTAPQGGQAAMEVLWKSLLQTLTPFANTSGFPQGEVLRAVAAPVIGGGQSSPLFPMITGMAHREASTQSEPADPYG